MTSSSPRTRPPLVAAPSARLVYRMILPADAALLLALMNDPDYHRYIGDRGLKTIEDARHYIREHIAPHHTRHGYGLWLAATQTGTPVGIAGLLKRDRLDEPDIGYALLAGARGKGYGREAAAAMLAHGFLALSARNLYAITNPENAVSNGLLASLGFSVIDGAFQMTPEAKPSYLHRLERPATLAPAS